MVDDAQQTTPSPALLRLLDKAIFGTVEQIAAAADRMAASSGQMTGDRALRLFAESLRTAPEFRRPQ